MIKPITTLFLTSMFLLPAAWAHETLPAERPETETLGDGLAPIQAQPSKRPDDPKARPSPLKGFYAGASIGPVFFENNDIGNFDIDYDVGSQFTALIGARLGILRGEFEIASEYAEFDPSNSVFDGDVNIFRATVNAYLDIYTFNPDVKWLKGGFTPYFGGGLGIAVADIEGFDDDDAGFTVNGEAGVSIPVFKQIDVVPAYRFEWTDFDEFDDNQRAHIIRVGAHYSF